MEAEGLFFWLCSQNSATGQLSASEIVSIPPYPMPHEQFLYNQAICD
jgi:hypothetical protein